MNQENQSSPYTSSYRSEIDGLRAFAVLSVVAFHAFPSWLKGGFIGVDVFFVISGFLITSHIFEKLDRGQFSFTDFFGRRIRRIFPALILVMACSLAFGWFALLADEFAQLGKHVASGATFITNFILVDESGYFDNAAETKPMLHLWSLAIEEQFYIVWPLVLWLAWKRKFNLLTITILVAAVSFYLNLRFVKSHPIETFFWPVGHFWELLSGSVLAWLLLHKADLLSRFKLWVDKFLVRIIYSKEVDADGTTTSNLMSFCGLLLLAYGVIRINESLSFPSKWALIPVLGAVLIIASGSKAWLNRIFLMNPLAVWFGLISYPLYLWHWPILSFLQIVEGEVPLRDARIIAVLLSIFLAWLTYRFMEKPIRRKSVKHSRSLALSFALFVIGALGYVVDQKEGFDWRSVQQLSTIHTAKTQLGAMVSMDSNCGLSGEAKEKIAVCMKDNRANPIFGMLGDSKAASLIGGVVRTSNEDGRWLMIGGSNDNGNPSPFHPNYKIHNLLLLHSIQALKANENIKVVALVYAAREFAQDSNVFTWRHLPTLEEENFNFGVKHLSLVVNDLVSSGKKVVLVVDNPPLGKQESCGARLSKLYFLGIVKMNKESEECSLTIDEYKQFRSRYLEGLERVQRTYPNQVKIFDTMRDFCDVENKLCMRVKNGEQSFGYSDHISDYMAGLIGVSLNKFVIDWVKDSD